MSPQQKESFVTAGVSQKDKRKEEPGVLPQQPSKHTTRSTMSAAHNPSSSSPKLYGQDEQRQQLLDGFERSCDSNDHKNRELTVITGSSGTGKTVLARMLQSHAKYFVLGKCDQFQQGSEPFGPFISSLTQLAHEILQENEEETTLQQVRSRVQEVISESTEVNLLLDVVPALAQFFPNRVQQHGSLESTTVMQHPEVENPILDVIYNFLRSVCSQKQSIVMVIDDIQWIDYSSLELLKKLTEEKPIQGFMLVTTCRDDEMTDDNPAQQVLHNLQQENNDATVSYIALENLTLEAVRELASDQFPTLPEMGIEALSSVLHQHTKGNAFFTTQLVKRLEDSGWKTPKYQDEMKDWDFDEHRSMVDRFIKYDCDALVDFLVVDTANESPLVRQVLKVSSCLGSNFVASHVMMIVEGSKDEISEALSLIEHRGIINRRHGGKDGWSWTHDKYQKAAYLLIKTTERKSFHLTVGRQLLSSLGNDELQEYVFIVAGQFGISLKVVEEDEKEGIANLFLQAGKRSALSSSFTAAASYFAMGTSLLKQDNWTSQYDLSLRLYNAAAEMECFRGHYQQTDKLVNVILRNTRTLEDRIRAYEVKLYSLGSKQETKQVSCLVLDIFKQLGEKFPAKVRFSKLLYEILTTKWLLSSKTEADILSLPPLQDWKKRAVLSIMQYAFPALIRGNPELAILISFRCMKLTLKYGICGLSSCAFLTVCSSITYPLGCIEEGIRLAKIGKRIIDEYDADELKCREHLVMYAYMLPYKEPLRDMLEPLETGGQLGIMSGDVDIACQCLVFRVVTAIFCGWDLERVLSMTKEYAKNFQSWDQQLHVSSTSMLSQTVENLIRSTSDPCVLTGTSFNEHKWIEKSEDAHNDQEAILFWLFKAFIALYMGEYVKCSEFMSMVMKQSLNPSVPSMFHQIYFITAVADVLVARSKNKDKKTRRKWGKSQKSFKTAMEQLQTYSKVGPDNIMNKIYLIEAERAVLKNDREDAKSKFRMSIDHAHRQGFVHEEALAYERFAIALSEWGEVTESLEFFERARFLYGSQWRSDVKVKQLEEYVREECGVRNRSWNTES